MNLAATRLRRPRAAMSSNKAQRCRYTRMVLLHPLCACGLAIGLMATRDLVPGYLGASGLMRSVRPLISQYLDRTAAAIAPPCIAPGSVEVTMRTTRKAVTLPSSNDTVREAQKRRAIRLAGGLCRRVAERPLRSTLIDRVDGSLWPQAAGVSARLKCGSATDRRRSHPHAYRHEAVRWLPRGYRHLRAARCR